MRDVANDVAQRPVHLVRLNVRIVFRLAFLWRSFQEIAERFGGPRVALLPISPGSPRRLFGTVHLDAQDAAIAARTLHAKVSIPIHFGTFAQGDEADGEAEAKLRAALREPGSAPFVILKNGGSFTSSPAGGGS